MAWRNRRFSVRSFLKEREALLVHFSTAYSVHPDVSYPDDLRRAARLRDEVLSFSTILKGDVGPYQGDVHPEDANAQGSIGLVVDITGDDCVTSVGAGDFGIQIDLTTRSVFMSGRKPSAVECARSIDERRGANDWRVKNYRVLGVFVFEPAMAFRPLNDLVIEVPLQIEEILSAFPGERVFSSNKESFIEYDRVAGGWVPSTYDQIVPPASGAASSASWDDRPRSESSGELAP